MESCLKACVCSGEDFILLLKKSLPDWSKPLVAGCTLDRQSMRAVRQQGDEDNKIQDNNNSW